MRRTKCLISGKVVDCVIVNGKRKIIEVDKEHGEYIYVANEKITGTDLDKKLKSFTGRIKDAVDTIREGNGDVIRQGIFGGEEVIYFLDREVGEKLRKKSLEGWKDTKFAWVLRFENKNSMYRGAHLHKYNEVSVFSEEPLLYFDTEEEARKYSEKLIEVAYRDAQRLVEDMKDKNGDQDELCQWFDEFDAKHGKNSVVQDMIFDMCVDNAKALKFTEPKLDKYNLRVEQFIVK